MPPVPPAGGPLAPCLGSDRAMPSQRSGPRRRATGRWRVPGIFGHAGIQGGPYGVRRLNACGMMAASGRGYVLNASYLSVYSRSRSLESSGPRRINRVCDPVASVI